MFAPNACRSVTETIPCAVWQAMLYCAGGVDPQVWRFRLRQVSRSSSAQCGAALRGFRLRAKLPLSASSAAGPAPRRLRFRLACGYILRKLK
jgi:hypothetical protein